VESQPTSEVTQDKAATLSFALTHAAQLLDRDTALALEQTREILKVFPGQPQAILLHSIALRRRGNLAEAVDGLQSLIRRQPRWWQAHMQLGLALSAGGHSDAAIDSLRRATECDPNQTDAWRALGDQYRLSGQTAKAEICNQEQIRTAIRHPGLIAAAEQLSRNDLPAAERSLKIHLSEVPSDFVAIRMLAELASRLGRYEDAENLLRRCVEIAPNFTAAQQNFAFVLLRQNKAAEALVVVERQLALEPADPHNRALKAGCLVQIGRYAEAIEIYKDVLEQYPAQPKLWMSYGHALKTDNRREECIAAYRRCISLTPGLGEGYWSLANLKTFRFDDSDIAMMRTQLQRLDLREEDRLHFHFALGKALEDRSLFADSFTQYRLGNELRRAQIGYEAKETSERVDRAIAVFDSAYFSSRPNYGYQASDPIFVIGLPRSGSTLIEQVLASHSEVEGTMELPDLVALANQLGGRKKRGDSNRYPELLTELDPSRFIELGEDYLRRVRVQRKTTKPYFIDKMPNNFFHVGLIHMILPNAKIIDARRHPMATCFSAYKQHFARGQGFSYDLADLGKYYSDYVRLMTHFDDALPARIHRVDYEDMVNDSERTIRRLLDYCGLSFEPACLTFWLNNRSVRTASADQVRRPIFTDGLDQWRHYESWLDELKSALRSSDHRSA
jgi:tetratricopeptide (TPR) repeat protein